MGRKLWDIFKAKVDRFGIEDFFGWLAAFAVFLAVIAGGITFFGDKTVKCYYLSSRISAAGTAYQIYASSNYSVDAVAFASSDYKETMKIFNTLPKCGSCIEEE